MSDPEWYQFKRGYNQALDDVKDELVSNSRWSQQMNSQAITWDQVRNTLEQLEKDDD